MRIVGLVNVHLDVCSPKMGHAPILPGFVHESVRGLMRSRSICADVYCCPTNCSLNWPRSLQRTPSERSPAFIQFSRRRRVALEEMCVRSFESTRAPKNGFFGLLFQPFRLSLPPPGPPNVSVLQLPGEGRRTNQVLPRLLLRVR